VTERPVRQQRIMARELTLRALARDASGGEPYKLVLAEGPGVVRIWEAGSKDEDPNRPRPPGAKGGESEMKLTVVTFSGRMTAKDKGPSYKDATFLDPVEVIHVPTNDPDLKVERHRMPPQATLLTCSREFVVWTHKKGADPAEQHMRASGNAYLRNEDYDGWGETITNDGKKVVFDAGTGSVPAHIKGRFNGNDQTGKRIIYDRAKNHFEVEDAIGGTINTATTGGPKKK
jgi:hypothetical protein